MYSRKRKQEYLKVCPTCERTFVATHFERVYCSCWCASADEWKNADNNFSNPASYVKRCALCGKKFKTLSYENKYCSRKCQKKVKRAEYPWEKLRFEIFRRDNFTCQYCGSNPTEDEVRLHIDHIKPKIDGGKDTPDNLVTACSKCNIHKSSRPLPHEAEFKERIKRR